MTDPKTLAIYAEKAGEYAELTDAINTEDPMLASFIAAIPAGGAVLDLGCGPGASAAVMARAGLKVTATDAVPEMVAMAKAHPGVSATVATFDDISGTDVFDGIWASFSLLHAPRDAMPRHLQALAQALKPGGVLYIAVKTGTGSHRDSLGRLYTYYTDAELTGLLADVGLNVTIRKTGTTPGLSGEEAPWIAMMTHA